MFFHISRPEIVQGTSTNSVLATFVKFTIVHIVEYSITFR